MAKPITIILDADTGKATVKIDQAAGAVSGSMDKMNKSIGSTDAAVLKADASLNKAIGTLTKLAAVGAAAVTAVFVASAKAGMEFEQEVVKVGNASSLLGRELDMLTAKARDLGRQTGQSAGEILKGERAFVQIGLSAEGAAAAIEQATQLAVSRGEDISVAVDGIGEAFDKFNAKAEDAQKITDTLTAALQHSQFDGLEPMVQELKVAAKETSVLGMSFEATLQGVVLFDKLGFSASSLGMSMRFLAKNSDITQQALDSLGVTFDEVNPAAVDFTDIIRRFTETSIGAQDAIKIFGDSAGLAMLGVIDKIREMPEELDAMDAAFSKSAGITKKAFDDMMGTVGQILKSIKGEINDVLLTLYEAYKDRLAEIAKVVREKIGEIGQYLASEEFQARLSAIFDKIHQVGRAVYETLSSVAGIAVDAFKWAYDNRIIVGIAALGTAVVALNIKLMALKIQLAATGGLMATLKAKALLLNDAVMFAGGWPLVIAAATAAFIALNNAANQVEATLNRLKGEIDKTGESIDKQREWLLILGEKYGGFATEAYQAYLKSSEALEGVRGQLETLGVDVDAVARKLFEAGGSATALGAELEKALAGKKYQVVIEAGKVSLTKMSMDIDQAVKDGVKNWPEHVRERAAEIASAVGAAIFDAAATGDFQAFMTTVETTLYGYVKEAVMQGFIDSIISRQVIEPLVALLEEINVSTTEGLSEWMAKAREAVGEATASFEALWPVVQMIQEEFAFLAPTVEEAGNALSESIGGLETRTDTLADDFGGLSNAAQDAASGLIDAASAATSSIESSVGQITSSFGFSGTYKGYGKWETDQGEVYTDAWGQLWYRQFQSGTEHVAKTGPAIVHEGEKIVRAADAGGSGDRVEVVFNIRALDPVGMKKVVRDDIIPQMKAAAARGWM